MILKIQFLPLCGGGGGGEAGQHGQSGNDALQSLGYGADEGEVC